MSERAAFLASIRESPADDLPRLVFADWLDDNGDQPHDAATAEFIRLSCKLDAKKSRQSRKEGAWLHANWMRLVPKLAGDGFSLYRRNGRRVTFIREDELPPAPLAIGSAKRTFARWCIIDFWRGFAAQIYTYQPRDLPIVVQAARTQPLATLMCGDALYGNDGRFVEISSRSFRRAPTLDIFDRITGYDVLVADIGYEPELNENNYLVKRFNRSGCRERAERALSDAIRSFVDDNPSLA